MARKDRVLINNPYALQNRQNKILSAYESAVSDTLSLDGNVNINTPEILGKFLSSKDSNVTSLGVAMFNRNIGSLVDNSMQVMAALETLSPYEHRRTPLPFGENKVIERVYTELGRKLEGINVNFFDTLTDSDYGTPTTIKWDNMPGYHSHQTAAQAQQAIENARQNGFVAWDLETTAGKTQGAENLPAHITEFSFAKTAVDSQDIEWHNSIIGATQAEYDEYNDLINKFRRGERLTQEEAVTFDRLMLAGHTSSRAVMDSNGVWNYENFVGADDILYKDWTVAQRGADTLREIGKQQSENLVNFSVGGRNFRATTWERELLSGINAIVNEGATAVGFNSRTFDMNRLNQLLSSDKVSKDVRDAVNDWFGNKTISFENHLDILPMAREFHLRSDYTAEDYAEMQKHGLSEYQQETLVRKFTSPSGKLFAGDNYYDQKGLVAHLATTDVGAVAELARRKVFNPNDSWSYSDAAVNSQVTVEGSRNQLFLAKQSINTGRYNLLVGMQDALSGELRFGDKMSVDEDGNVSKQLFGQAGIQRGVTYQLNGLYEVDNTMKQTLGELYPQLAIDKLTVAKLDAYTDGKSNTVRANSSLFYIGYKEDIQHALMDNTVYIGTNENEQIKSDILPGSKTARDLTIFNSVETSAGNVPVSSQADVNTIIGTGAKKSQEDAAARYTRYKDYSKDFKLIRLMDALDEAHSKMGGTIESIENVFFTNSVNISKKLLSGGTVDVNSDEYKYSYNAYLGYRDPVTHQEGKLYSETLSAQRARLAWARNNQSLIRTALDKARSVGGSDFNKVKFAYTKIMQGVEDYIRNTGDLTALGYEKTPVLGYEFMNRFDVNLRGFNGINEDRIISLDMNAFGGTTADKIIRSLKNGSSLRDYDDDKKSNLLRRFQDFLYKQNILKHSDSNSEISSNDTLARAGDKFNNSLLEARLSDVSVGHLTDPETGDIRGLTRLGIESVNLSRAIGDQTKINELVNELGDKYVEQLRGVFALPTTPEGRAKIASQARELALDAANFLYDTNDINALEKLDAGYTQKEISNLRKIQRVYQRDMFDYLQEYFKQVGELGGQIELNSKARKVYATYGGDTIELELPTGEVRGGQYQTRLGRQSVSLGVGLYDVRRFGANDPQFEFSSIIKKAFNTNINLLNYHKKLAQRDGNVLEHIQRMSSGINKFIRESPVVKEFGEIQRTNQFLLDYWDVLQNVSSVLTEEDVETIAQRTAKPLDSAGEVLRDELGRERESYSVEVIRKLQQGKMKIGDVNPDMGGLNALFKNFDVVYKRLQARGILTEEAREMFDQMQMDYRKSYKGFGVIGYLPGDYTHRYNKQVRKPVSIEDATHLDIDKFNEYKAQSEVLRDVEIGAGMTQERRSKMAQFADGIVDENGNPTNVNNRIRVNALHMNRGGFAAVANKGLNELMKMAASDPSKLLQLGITQEEVASSSDLLRTVFIDEGTAFMHGEIFDRTMHVRDSIQKIALDNVVISDGLTINEVQAKSKAIPKIKFDADGKISFEYDTGMFVAHDDIIASKKGMLGGSVPVTAKYDGVFNFGLFNNEGHLIEQEKITNILNSDKAFLQELQDMNNTQRAQAVMDYLENKKKFNWNYYLQEGFANHLVKVAEFSEKGMTQALIAKTGSIDKRIASVMERLGFQGDLTYGKGRSLYQVGYLDIGMIDSLGESDISKSRFAVEAQGRLEKLGRNRVNINTVLKAAGFSDAKDFQQAILRERYAPSRVLTAMLRHVDYGNGQHILDADESWHIVTGHMQSGMAKHGDITQYRYLTDEWIKRGIQGTGDVTKGLEQARENIVKYLLPSELQEEIAKGNINDYIKLDVKNKGLILDDKFAEEKIDRLNYSDLQEAYQKTGLMDANGNFVGMKSLEFAVGDQNARVGVEKIRSEISRVGNYWDREKTTPDAVKFNQRAITIAELTRFGDIGKTNVRKFLAETGREEIYDKLEQAGKLQTGEVVNSAAVDQIRRNIYNRSGGGEKISGYFMNQAGTDLEWGINDTALEQLVKKENLFNGDVKRGVEMMHTMLDNYKTQMGITTVNKTGALEAYKSFSATMAAAFQTQQVSLDNMEKMGFKTVNVKDVDVSNHSANSIFNQNVIVDMSTGNAEIDKALFGDDSRKRYLALSYNPVGENERYTTAQAKFASVQEAIKEYQEFSSGLSDDPDFMAHKGHKLEQLAAKLIQARDATWNAYHSKNGIVANSLKAHMQGAVRATSRGMDLLGIEHNEDLSLEELSQRYGSKISKLEINGINLLEEAKRKHAIQFNYTILSTDHMHEIYDPELKNIFQDLGLDTSDQSYKDVQNQLYEELQTKGTHGISAREPLQYLGSVQQRQIFFSNMIGRNTAIGNFTGAGMRKEDFDSDAVVNAVHREQAKIEYNGKIINANIDSALMNVLESKGMKVTLLDEGGAERMANYDTAQVYIGAGEAQRYREFVDFAKAQVPKQSSIFLSDVEEADIRSGKAPFKAIYLDPFSGKKFTQKVSGYNLGELQARREEYHAVEAEMFKRDANYINMSGVDRRMAIMDYQKELVNAGDTVNADRVGRALQTSIIDETLAGDLMGLTAQPYGAGIINHYTQTVANIATEAFNSAGASEFLKAKGVDAGQLLQDITLVNLGLQEGFLSPKNNVGEVDTSQISSMFRDIFSMPDNATEAERYAMKQRVVNTIGGTIKDRIDKEMPKLQDLFDRSGLPVPLEGEDLLKRTDQALWNYANFMVDDIAARGNVSGLFGTAASGDQAFKTGFKVSALKNSTRLIDQNLRVYDSVASSLTGVDRILAEQFDVGFKGVTSSEGMDNVQRNINRMDNAREVQMASSEAAEGIAKRIGKIGGVTGLAIGIAGGLMLAGFVHDPSGGQHHGRNIPIAESSVFGNQPIPNSALPEPAIDQAQSGAAYISDNQMPLADSNLNVLRGGPRTSYVINISGNSPQGAQAAERAINSAIAGPVPNNSSINVAVNNNFQDTLNQMQVSRMVQTAMGF